MNFMILHYLVQVILDHNHGELVPVTAIFGHIEYFARGWTPTEWLMPPYMSLLVFIPQNPVLSEIVTLHLDVESVFAADNYYANPNLELAFSRWTAKRLSPASTSDGFNRRTTNRCGVSLFQF
jgi:hypothetical protein